LGEAVSDDIVDVDVVEDVVHISEQRLALISGVVGIAIGDSWLVLNQKEPNVCLKKNKPSSIDLRVVL